MSEGSVVTVELGDEDFRTRVRSRGHEVFVDEPGELGGGDTAPGPYELLLASLGSCKAITARMYAKRKGWDLRGVRLDLVHSRPGGRDEPELIEVSIGFTGELDDEQLRRLKEIAEKCPVQRTLGGGLRVETVLEG